MHAVHTQAEIARRETVARSTLLLELRAEDLFCDGRRPAPGQFVMLGPLDGESTDPFLNRPFSIHRLSGRDRLELLIAVVGRGTRILGSLAPGGRIGLLGPLGNGFTLPDPSRPALLVAGGLGVAPLFFLAEELCARGARPRLLYGAGSVDRLVPTDGLQAKGASVKLATDDGSAGFAGLVSELLAGELSDAALRGAYVAACGPEPMLRAVADLARGRGLDLQVSLESRMACGLGACLGCTVFLPGGAGVRVCCDGPVFSAREVFGP
jgi:dihydroorotate dehydrogenase electron transfer subunit